MRFTAQEEYGLRCMLQLARRAPVPPASLSIAEIAEAESLTPAYVAKLMRILRKARLVEGTRGQKGGYHLPRPAAEVSVGEVLVALGGKLYSPEFCDRHAGNEPSCVHTTDCSVRALWGRVDSLVHSVLDRTSLADLAGAEAPAPTGTPLPVVTSRP
jgi:Rrf2 family protein